MARVIGIEGRWVDNALVQWATPVIELDDGKILNPVTNRILSPERLSALTEAGHVSRIEQAIVLDKELAGKPAALLIVARTEPFTSLFELKSGLPEHLFRHHQTAQYHYYLFLDEQRFEQEREHIIANALQELLARTWQDKERKRILDACLVLNAHNPDVHAFRVHYLTARSETDIMIAESHLTPEGVDRFRLLGKTLQTGESPRAAADSPRTAKEPAPYLRGPKKTGFIRDMRRELRAA